MTFFNPPEGMSSSEAIEAILTNSPGKGFVWAINNYDLSNENTTVFLYAIGENAADLTRASNHEVFVSLNFLRRRYNVTARQISAWAQRHTGGFPEPVGHKSEAWYPGDRPGAPVFALSEVDEWHSRYDVNGLRGSHWAKKRELSTSSKELPQRR